jgi:transcriptional regulator GlxA family with amidase domain
MIVSEMTNISNFQTSRSAALLVYPGFDLLDLAGPIAAFNDANVLVAKAYDVTVISCAGGLVESSAGVAVATSPSNRQASADTLIVIGGAMPAVRATAPELISEIQRLAPGCRRVASVCSGAFLLGAAGLLDNRRATTHWKFSAELQALAPAARVEADRLFVQDGPIWCSAGATAGIDLTLALIEDDLGAEHAKAIARGLVMSHRRVGGQSQYSALLELEPPSDRIRRVLLYARDNLAEFLPVHRLAAAGALSERQFTRMFLRETGMTPAKAVEKLRVEAAQPQVEMLAAPLETIARSVGFSDAEHMRQAFLRCNGYAPAALRNARRVRNA